MDPDLEQYWNEYEAQVSSSSSSKGKINKKPQRTVSPQRPDGISKSDELAEHQNSSISETKQPNDFKKGPETKKTSGTKKATGSKKSNDTKKGFSEVETTQGLNTVVLEKSSSKKKEDKNPEPPSSKKKPQNTAILAIKRMQEAMKAQEDELKRLEEEERQKEQDAQREAEEKRLAEEAESQRKRDRRKALKKEGTKAERERLKIDREKVTILQQQFSNHRDLDNLSQDLAPEKKKLIYTKKKISFKSSGASSKTASTHTSNLSTPCSLSDQGSLSTDTGSSEEEILDSWEDALEDKDEDAAIAGLAALNCKDEGTIDQLQTTAQPQKSTSADAPMDIPPLSRRIPAAMGAPAHHKSPTVFAPIKAPTSIDSARHNEKPIPVAPLGPELMSPIICVLGHVDTGKTKLLDKLRETSVQESEAGGITQQIGATFFPREAIIAKMLITGSEDAGPQVKIPGLVVIDTPGHASFANLRDRGSSLCHLAVLVVDIMHGLEPQTLESIELLRRRRTPFVVALNKIDRLYDWRPVPGARNWAEIEAAQRPSTVAEFRDRLDRTKLAFASQAALNAELHQENTDPRSTISLIPISALTGEGIPDLLRTVVMLTQERLGATLVFDDSRFSAFVLEVKDVEGLGHVIDVILTQGTLAEGDQFAVAGLSGPILSQVRSLLTPEPMKESRVKTLRYLHHTSVRACMGVRIVGPNLETAVAGSRLVRVNKSDAGEGNDDAATVAMKLVDEEMNEVLGIRAALSSAADRCRSGAAGVSVQASTLGSLEALLTFLAGNDVPVATASIGTIYKRDILTTAANLERWTTAGNPEARDYAAVLAFDVRVDREAQELAEDLGIKIFSADIIYHLLDTFRAHRSVLVEQRKRDLAPQAVFPCVLKIVPGCVFNKRSPIILGVQVTEGVLRIGTPLVVHQGEGKALSIGRVTSIELNHRPVDRIRRGGSSVAIKIEQASYEVPRMVGRHFDESDELLSAVSRTSIDILKTSFREEMTAEDWQLVRRLKGFFGIQ